MNFNDNIPWCVSGQVEAKKQEAKDPLIEDADDADDDFSDEEDLEVNATRFLWTLQTYCAETCWLW